MKIAVTGGSGAIGTYVCDELAAAGHNVTSLDLAPPKVDVAFREVDLTNLAETCKAVDGFDQIVHLAAIPDPYGDDPPETVISVNTAISYNVFEAARLKGVNRVIYGCSESSTGFGIHSVELVPQYVPIDEEHPLWPHETYSLSEAFRRANWRQLWPRRLAWRSSLCVHVGLDEAYRGVHKEHRCPRSRRP